MCKVREDMNLTFKDVVHECNKIVDSLANYAYSYWTLNVFYNAFDLPTIIKGEVTMDKTSLPYLRL